jgi:hypothetical protein
VALGARTAAPIGETNIPVALLPVLEGDVSGVELMRKLGVRYSKLRYRGATALDFARRLNNEAMLAALGGGDTTL